MTHGIDKMTTRNARPVRVLLVDDSPIVLSILERILSADPRIEVVGKAYNGDDALQQVRRLEPTILCTDLHMPGMDGLELTRRVMDEYPLPILVVSVSVGPDQKDNVFNLIEAGAVDVFSKPRSGFRIDSAEARELRERIKLISGVRVFRRKRKEVSVKSAAASVPDANSHIVAIGASTGGPQALMAILSSLPADYPMPVLCVQHICSGFLQSLVDWLDGRCALKVKMAGDGERIEQGHVYFPAEDTHLVVESHMFLKLSRNEPEGGHRPSVDTLFRSVARHYGNTAVAVLLSGMGRDGAEGMEIIALAGGQTIAQDEATSVVFGMPNEAIKLGAVKHVLPIEEIGPFLSRLAMKKR